MSYVEQYLEEARKIIDGIDPEDVTPGVARDGQASLFVDGHAVRAGLRPRIRPGSLVAAGVHKNRGALTRDPSDDAVVMDGREVKIPVDPDGAFRPLITTDNFLNFGPLGDDGVNRGIETHD